MVALEDLYVKISWPTPFANYQPVTSFIVQIIDANGDFVEAASLCNGSDASTFADSFCLIQMSSFEGEPLELPQDTVIKAKVIAVNSRGQSQLSEESIATNIVVETRPAQVTTLDNGVDTTHEQIHLTWDALSHPDTGSSSITSYHLQMRQVGESAWSDVTGH